MLIEIITLQLEVNVKLQSRKFTYVIGGHTNVNVFNVIFWDIEHFLI